MTQFNVQQLLFAYGASLIRSIQQVSITIPTSATTNTATISNVTTGNAVVFLGGINPQTTGVNPNSALAGVSLTNGTTVTATRNTADASNTTTVNATVVEFQPGIVKSNQSGTIALSTSQTSNTATITSVTTGNAVCIFNGSTYASSTQNSGDYLLATYLSNSTTVEAIRGSNVNSIAAVAYYTVLEFNSGILNSSTQSGSISSISASATATITAVTTSQSMVVSGGYNYAGNSGSTGIVTSYLTLTNGTTVTRTIPTTASYNVTHYFTVIEFKSINIRSVNRNTTSIAASSTSNTATITAVNTAKSIPNFTGYNSSVSTTDYAITSGAMALTNATTVTVTVKSAPSGTVPVGWEIIEFI